MENLKIRVSNEEESKEAQQLFFELGATLGNGDHHAVIVPGAIGLAVIDGLINFVFSPIVHSDIAQAREITLPELRDMVAQKRKQPDAAASSNEIVKKEYLLPKDQGYELCLCEEGMTIHKSWIEVPEGAEIAVLFEPKMTCSRSGELFFWKDNGDTHYIYSERSGCQRPTGWYSCKGNMLTTLDEFLQSWAGQCRIIWRREQSDAAASLNETVKTAEDHRQKLISGGTDISNRSLFIGQNAFHTAKENAEKLGELNLANELNDLCAEFGCLPGADRMQWLRDRLRGTRKPETLYHYSASINTARGTVAYDGVITFPGRITGIEDYQQARAEIAKDGNVAPEQVNVHSLSIVS